MTKYSEDRKNIISFLKKSKVNYNIRQISKETGANYSSTNHIVNDLSDRNLIKIEEIIVDGKNTKNFRIPVLVALHFIGPKPSPLHEVNHKNGDKDNNHYLNLELKEFREI